MAGFLTCCFEFSVFKTAAIQCDQIKKVAIFQFGDFLLTIPLNYSKFLIFNSRAIFIEKSQRQDALF